MQTLKNYFFGFLAPQTFKFQIFLNFALTKNIQGLDMGEREQYITYYFKYFY